MRAVAFERNGGLDVLEPVPEARRTSGTLLLLP
jgi:hypothetical protein